MYYKDSDVGGNKVLRSLQIGDANTVGTLTIKDSLDYRYQRVINAGRIEFSSSDISSSLTLEDGRILGVYAPITTLNDGIGIINVNGSTVFHQDIGTSSKRLNSLVVNEGTVTTVQKPVYLSDFGLINLNKEKLIVNSNINTATILSSGGQVEFNAENINVTLLRAMEFNDKSTVSVNGNTTVNGYIRSDGSTFNVSGILELKRPYIDTNVTIPPYNAILYRHRFNNTVFNLEAGSIIKFTCTNMVNNTYLTNIATGNTFINVTVAGDQMGQFVVDENTALDISKNNFVTITLKDKANVLIQGSTKDYMLFWKDPSSSNASLVIPTNVSFNVDYLGGPKLSKWDYKNGIITQSDNAKTGVVQFLNDQNYTVLAGSDFVKTIFSSTDADAINLKNALVSIAHGDGSASIITALQQLSPTSSIFTGIDSGIKSSLNNLFASRNVSFAITEAFGVAAGSGL